MTPLLLLCATLVAAGPVEPSARWSGKGADSALQELAPPCGFFNDADSFAEAWKGWRPTEDVPAVDFDKELILVGTASGPNTVLMKPSLDDAGQLKFVAASTRVAGPGFGYLMLQVSRDGVKTVNGNSADPRVRQLRFATHDGYFASNQFERNAESSFVVLENQAAFDEVFGVAFVMGDKARRLPPEAFESRMVVGVIHRGNTLWNYKVQAVEREGESLTVRYTTTRSGQQTATFASPLIVSLPRGETTTITFVEDGKPVKTLKTGPPRE